MIGPTERQAEVLNFVATHIKERGYAPTLREIGEALGIKSTNGVADHLQRLARKGYVTWTPGAARTLRLVAGDRDDLP